MSVSPKPYQTRPMACPSAPEVYWGPVEEMPKKTQNRFANTIGAPTIARDITDHKSIEKPRGSEGELRLILESVTDAITITDLNGTITDCNGRTVRMHGFSSKSQILGKSAFDLIAPHDHKRAMVNMKKTLDEGAIDSLEYTLIRADGSTFAGELGVSLIKDAPGNPVGFVAIARDITERKQAEAELRSSREYLGKLNDSLEEVIFTVTYPERIIRYVNRSMRRVFGYEVEECIGKNTEFLFSTAQEYQGLGDKLRDLIKEEGTSSHAECLMKRKNGELFPAEVTTTFLKEDGRITQVIGVTRDITERKQAEEQLRISRQEMRNLYAHAQSVREQVRATIAREIHDELGQVLAALRLDLFWLRKNLPKGQDSLAQKTETMSNLIGDTIQTVRRISSELRPQILDDLGLLAAIEWYAGELQKRSAIEVKVSSVPEDIILSDEQSIVIFRIVQQALTNVAQHAGATEALVNLKKENGRLAMRIADNGRGITPEEISAPTAFGLMGMRERIRFLGGDFEIKGTPGKGTTITVEVPVSEEKL